MYRYDGYDDNAVSQDVYKIKVEPYMIDMMIGQKNMKMELDTGASRTIISECMYRSYLSQYKLSKCYAKLRSYTGEVVPVVGEIVVPVQYEGRKYSNMSLVVVGGNKTGLLGRDWLSAIKLKWETIFTCRDEKVPCSADDLLEKYRSVFTPDKEGIRGLRASLKLKPNVQPVFQKHRNVPHAMLSEVEKEYDRLLKNNIFYWVEHSDWGSPVVNVPKENGIRTCGDYKKLNELLENDSYKLPNVQDLFAQLAKAGQPRVFTVLDCSGAFNQLSLDEESTKLLVLNTHKGLLGTNRLSYRVKVAPGQFQRAMDKILVGIDNVYCYIDDILVATNDIFQHRKTLEEVLRRLDQYNVKLNKTKSKFLQKQVQYLGHILSAEGVHPVQNEVEAIMKAPQPQNVSELKSFLGMVNFYGKFIPRLSLELQALYKLMQQNKKWEWTSKQEKAFDFAKKAISSARVLVHYDPSKPVKLSCGCKPVRGRSCDKPYPGRRY